MLGRYAAFLRTFRTSVYERDASTNFDKIKRKNTWVETITLMNKDCVWPECCEKAHTNGFAVRQHGYSTQGDLKRSRCWGPRIIIYGDIICRQLTFSHAYLQGTGLMCSMMLEVSCFMKRWWRNTGHHAMEQKAVGDKFVVKYHDFEEGKWRKFHSPRIWERPNFSFGFGWCLECFWWTGSVS